jgi:protein-tyrosine phosphatase
MAERGVDISAHRSRPLTSQLVAEADLVLAMERSHVAEVVVLVPDAVRRTLTVRELGRRVWDTGPRPASEPISVWVQRAVGDRDLRELLGTPQGADDIPDPIGHPISAYRKLVDELDEVLGRTARSIWTPPAP